MLAFDGNLGSPQRLAARLKDCSKLGLGVSVRLPLIAGTSVSIQGASAVKEIGLEDRPATVIWCFETEDGSYRAGFQFDSAKQYSSSASQSDSPGKSAGEPAIDHYEVLQLSPNADPDTVHRVYRLLAQRFHPDNPDSGDEERFKQLLESYRMLSDPEKRASFDAQRCARRDRQFQLLSKQPEGNGGGTEKHKRQLLLSLLYKQRVQDPRHPHLTLQEMEELLGYPRDHLEVSLWFLREKGYLMRTDNARFAITADGFEHAEAEKLPSFTQQKMLTDSGLPAGGSN